MVIVYILIAILIASVSLYFFCKWENKQFKITKYQLSVPKIKRDITLAVLSDIHNYQYGLNNERLLKALDDVNPDYVISAGDMIEGAMYAKGTRDTIAFLTRICKKYHFIYGCGNHEWKLLKDKKLYPKVTTEFEKGLMDGRDELGVCCPKRAPYIEPLDNECIELKNDNIKIYGLNLERDYFKKIVLNKTDKAHIDELVGRVSDAHYNILIGHNPDQFDAYADWGADLVLAGHVHGGMIATPWHRGLISPRFIPFPKYDGGLYKKKNTTMVLSRGLGNHTIHVRIFNRAELVVIRLKMQES